MESKNLLCCLQGNKMIDKLQIKVLENKYPIKFIKKDYGFDVIENDTNKAITFVFPDIPLSNVTNILKEYYINNLK